MTKLRDALEAADPVRHEPGPSEDDRARLRHTIVAEASTANAERAGRSMSVAMVVAFAAIVIAMVAISTMWRSGSTAQAAVRFEVRLAEDQAAAGLDAARVAQNRVIYLHRDAIVTNADIATSRVVPGATPSQFWIDVRLNDAGAQKMRQATTSHIGKPVAILIDGDVVAAPTVKSPIGAAAMISGDFTRADADRIAQGMNPNR